MGAAQHHLVGQAVEPVERHRPQLNHPAQHHQLARAQVRRRQEEEADRQRQKAVIPQLRAVVRLLLRRAAGVADRPRAVDPREAVARPRAAVVVAAILTATEVAIDQSSVGAITAAFGSDQSGTTGVVDGMITASANAGSKLPSGSSGFVPRRIVEPRPKSAAVGWLPWRRDPVITRPRLTAGLYLVAVFRTVLICGNVYPFTFVI